VSTGFLAILRQSRRPLIAVAIALTLLQTLVVGIATAQAAASLEPFEAGVICHAAGGQDPLSDPASDAHKALCCAVCIATAPVLLPLMPLVSEGRERVADGTVPVASHAIVLIARRAVRAGPSQAPPSLA
jgi:hypothetical protein